MLLVSLAQNVNGVQNANRVIFYDFVTTHWTSNQGILGSMPHYTILNRQIAYIFGCHYKPRSRVCALHRARKRTRVASVMELCIVALPPNRTHACMPVWGHRSCGQPVRR